MLTLNLLAVLEAHAGQVRAALEHLDVACSYVCSYWRQRERNRQERSNKRCGLVRTQGAGIFLRSPRLTCNIETHVEVHVRHFSAALESLDVTCSSCSLFKQQKVRSGRSHEKIPTKGADWYAEE